MYEQYTEQLSQFQPIGLPEYPEEPLIDASTLILFRKRLKMDIIMEANEYMLKVFKEKGTHDKNDDDNTNAPSGGSGEIKTEPESEQENEGTLMLDATCAPSYIRYPQDFSLLNEAREKLETIIIKKLPCTFESKETQHQENQSNRP